MGQAGRLHVMTNCYVTAGQQVSISVPFESCNLLFTPCQYRCRPCRHALTHGFQASWVNLRTVEIAFEHHVFKLQSHASHEQALHRPCMPASCLSRYVHGADSLSDERCYQSSVDVFISSIYRIRYLHTYSMLPLRAAPHHEWCR